MIIIIIILNNRSFIESKIKAIKKSILGINYNIAERMVRGIVIKERRWRGGNDYYVRRKRERKSDENKLF